MKKKIIYQIVQHLRPGGIEMMALDLLKHANSEYEVHIVSLEGNYDEFATKWPALVEYRDRLHFMGKKSGVSWCVFTKLLQLFLRTRPVAIHTHHIGPLLYGGLSAKLARVSSIVHTEHDGWHLNSPKASKLEGLLLKIIKPHLVADARNVAQALKEAIPKCNPITIMNGIDTDKFVKGDKYAARRHLNLPENALIIGCAARMEAEKSIHSILEVMPHLKGNIHLALAGDGTMRDFLEALAVKQNIQNRVHFLGLIDNMPQFYQALDVFCLPSIKEGLPLSPLEAQSCNIPCVVNDVGGCREAVCTSSGEMVNVGDLRHLRNALDRKLHQEQSDKPRDFVLQYGDVHKMASAYGDLYSNI